MGQGVLLDFFKSSSQRLSPLGPQETTDGYYEEEQGQEAILM
jgi:hypothetical protein